MFGKKPPKPPARLEPLIEISRLGGNRRGAILKEEVWSLEGEVIAYALAYINPRLSSVDNGRILGYDNSHGYHHRHFMGQVEAVEFPGYEALLDRFEKEVRELWRNEDEHNR